MRGPHHVGDRDPPSRPGPARLLNRIKANFEPVSLLSKEKVRRWGPTDLLRVYRSLGGGVGERSETGCSHHALGQPEDLLYVGVGVGVLFATVADLHQ